MAARAEAGAAGRSWWPTKARLGDRILATPKIKIVVKQKPYNFALSRIHKFQLDFEIQLKTSYRFLNISILGNLV